MKHMKRVERIIINNMEQAIKKAIEGGYERNGIPFKYDWYVGRETSDGNLALSMEMFYRPSRLR